MEILEKNKKGEYSNKDYMKKNAVILIISIIFIILVITSFVFYSMSLKDNMGLQEKGKKELEYISNQVITILGQFNGLSIGDYAIQLNAQKVSPEKEEKGKNEKNENNENEKNNPNKTKNNNTITNINDDRPNQVNQNQNQILAQEGKYETNWKFIEMETENLYQVWDSISLDLIELNVENKDITTFTDYLNQATQSIKQKDKTKSMQNLTELYKLIPKYSKSFLGETQETVALSIKADTVEAYANASNEKWDMAKENLNSAEQKFKNVLNNVELKHENPIILNQSYIILGELRKATELKDREIFFIQYKNLISRMQLFL